MAEEYCRRNPLIEFIEAHADGYPVLMHWPKDNRLIPVSKMKLYDQDAKYLEVEYQKPKTLKEIEQ